MNKVLDHNKWQSVTIIKIVTQIFISFFWERIVLWVGFFKIEMFLKLIKYS